MININSPRDYTLFELKRMVSIFGEVLLSNEFVTGITSSKKGIPIID